MIPVSAKKPPPCGAAKKKSGLIQGATAGQKRLVLPGGTNPGGIGCPREEMRPQGTGRKPKDLRAAPTRQRGFSAGISRRFFPGGTARKGRGRTVSARPTPPQARRCRAGRRARSKTNAPGQPARARCRSFQLFPLVLLMTLRRVNSSRSRSSSTPEIKRMFSSNFGMLTFSSILARRWVFLMATASR